MRRDWPLRSLRFIAGYMPGLTALRQYQWAWLRWDVIAGLSVCALLIPQGMAYGSLAGVAPVNGLYAALARGPRIYSFIHCLVPIASGWNLEFGFSNFIDPLFFELFSPLFHSWLHT